MHPKKNQWVDQPPAAYDIVTARFPETKPKAELRLRPCLVCQVLRESSSGAIACRVAFGTKHLKIIRRAHLDIIVQNANDLSSFGLPMATRFDLDSIIALPWTPEYFGCWSHRSHPKIGTLTEVYIRDYAFKMLLRGSL